MEKTKTAIKSLTAVGNYGKELCNVMNDVTNQAETTKKVFHEGNKSKLIKLGVALIVFPEPTPISEIVGGSLVAAGMIKKGIQKQSTFAEDIGKDFKKALKDLSLTKDLIYP